jgi:hypothetical protein
MLNELNSKGKLCDLMIGDSQWIGGAAESGHYVKLNDFFAKQCKAFFGGIFMLQCSKRCPEEGAMLFSN